MFKMFMVRSSTCNAAIERAEAWLDAQTCGAFNLKTHRKPRLRLATRASQNFSYSTPVKQAKNTTNEKHCINACRLSTRPPGAELVLKHSLAVLVAPEITAFYVLVPSRRSGRAVKIN